MAATHRHFISQCSSLSTTTLPGSSKPIAQALSHPFPLCHTPQPKTLETLSTNKPNTHPDYLDLLANTSPFVLIMIFVLDSQIPTSNLELPVALHSCIYGSTLQSLCLGQLSGVPQTMPGVVQNSLPFGALHMSLPLMPAQAMTQQATRHARRVYVGGLPPLANEQTIATFFSQVMAAIGGNSVGSISKLAGDGVMKKLYGVMKELHTLKEREPEVVIKSAASNLGCLDFDGLLDGDEMHSSDNVNEAKREREEGQQCTTCNI